MSGRRGAMPAGVYVDEMFGAAVAVRLTSRIAPRGLRVAWAAMVQRGGRDSAQLAYAAAQRLVLMTANLTDFLRLHEHWIADRDWGLLPSAHAGILVRAGSVDPLVWADAVADLLSNPRCPPLEDQLLLWKASLGQWEADYPYASRRRRTIHL